MTSHALPTHRTIRRPEHRLRALIARFRPRLQEDHFSRRVEEAFGLPHQRAAKRTATVEDVIERLDDWAVKQRAVTALVVEETARRRAQQDA